MDKFILFNCSVDRTAIMALLSWRLSRETCTILGKTSWELYLGATTSGTLSAEVEILGKN